MTYLEKLDWNFTNDETRYLTHSLHRYSSKFIPQIASTLIDKLTSPGDWILDCFCGSGTTLVESNLLRRHSIGIDLNPLACLISKAKTVPLGQNSSKLISEFLTRVKKDINMLRGQTTLDNLHYDWSPKPFDKELERWYHLNSLNELLIIREHIDRIQDQNIKNLVRVSFSEILRRSSRASSSFPNLMIDKNRKAVINTFELFERKVDVNFRRVLEYSVACNSEYIPFVVEGDSRQMCLGDACMDLVICHPPYVGAIPYAEFLKLSFLWLGLDDKFYDSVLIGGKRHNKHVLERFIESIKLVLKEISRVLKPYKCCAIVIGNPQVHGEIISLNDSMIKISRDYGLTKMTEIKRQRVNMRKGRVKDEYIIIFKKT